MVYLKFCSPDGERFDMGCLIMLGSVDSETLHDCRLHVFSTIENWTPEGRWEKIISNKCLTLNYKEYHLSCALVKLPHFDEPEVFCLVGDIPYSFEDIESEALLKFKNSGNI